jgi:hypothetical protein
VSLPNERLLQHQAQRHKQSKAQHNSQASVVVRRRRFYVASPSQARLVDLFSLRQFRNGRLPACRIHVAGVSGWNVADPGHNAETDQWPGEPRERGDRGREARRGSRGRARSVDSSSGPRAFLVRLEAAFEE